MTDDRTLPELPRSGPPQSTGDNTPSRADPPGVPNVPPQYASRAPRRVDFRSTWKRFTETARVRSFITVMGIAAVISGVYYFLIAAPMYASTSQFSIRTKTATTAVNATSVLDNLSNGGIKGPDLVAVETYIESEPMLNELDRRHHLRRDYTAPRIDFLRRLSPKASREDFLAFYNNQILVRIDQSSQLIQVEVRAFDPKTAKAVNESILELTEKFVDSLSARIQQETIKEAQQGLNDAQAAADKARAAQAAFQINNKDLNPTATGSATQSSVASLQTQINDSQTQLAALLTYNKPNAPAVQQMKAKIAEIKRQIAVAQSEQGAEGSNGLAAKVTEYQILSAQRDTAEATLKGAQQALDLAKQTAQQREEFVVNIVPPNLPDEPTRPRRLMDFTVVMILTAIGYGLVMLIVAAVRDHQGS